MSLPPIPQTPEDPYVGIQPFKIQLIPKDPLDPSEFKVVGGIAQTREELKDGNILILIHLLQPASKGSRWKWVEYRLDQYRAISVYNPAFSFSFSSKEPTQEFPTDQTTPLLTADNERRDVLYYAARHAGFEIAPEDVKPTSRESTEEDQEEKA